MSVQYLEDKFRGYKKFDVPVKRVDHGYFTTLPGQSEDGYGDKIVTDHVVTVPGSKRKYRVYCTCFSNCGSLWVVINNQKYHLRYDS